LKETIMHRRQFSHSLLALLATSRAFAQAVALDRSGLALGGYDPMAYFIYRRAAKGNTEFSMVWEGATYQFDSFEHLRIFATSRCAMRRSTAAIAQPRWQRANV
jgi:hypothetical protein